MRLSFLRHRWVAALAPLAFALLALQPTHGVAQASQGVQACAPSAGGDTCGGTGVASLGDGTNTGVGNPIHVVSGNKYQVEVDMPALPGELGLEVVRHYNSAHADVPGLLGAGWRLSYETRLHRVGNTVQILQADGGRNIFNIRPDNPSMCASDNPQLGRVHIDGNGAQTHYRWEWTHGEAAGRVLHFNARGQLERIVAASGAAVLLQRSPDGDLLSVTDPQGRSLHLVPRLNSSRQEAQAQGQAAWFAGTARIRTPLGDIEYHYGSGAKNTAQAANLVRVDSPSGQRHYHYEDPRHPAALTGISVTSAGEGKQEALQRVRTWSYDERGRAQGVQHDGQELQVQILKPALHQRDGLTWVRWRAVPNTNSSTSTPWQEALYRHRIIGGQYRLTEALGAACATCSPTGVRYRYDSSGRLQEITRLSAVTVKNGQASASPQPVEGVRHVHSQGQDNTPTLTIERVRYAKGQPQAAELIERQHFGDPRWSDKPTFIERPSVVAGLTHSLALRYNAAGQITEFTESGFSPLKADGQLASSPQKASPISRTQRWTYQTVGGVSVLTEHDGALPNGPQASPQDSDITRYRWSERGTQLLAVERSGGRSEVRYTEQGWISEVSHSLGQRIATPWLATLAPEQTLLHGTSHDMRGLAQYSAGNGIQTQWQRSSHPESFGTLARLVHRKPGQQQTAGVAQRRGPHLARSTQELIELLLGVRAAHAQKAVQPNSNADEKVNVVLPGALGLPADAQALLDQRYLWAGSGELLLTQGTRLGIAEQQAHAFDARGQLVASARQNQPPTTAPGPSKPSGATPTTRSSAACWPSRARAAKAWPARARPPPPSAACLRVIAPA